MENTIKSCPSNKGGLTPFREFENEDGSVTIRATQTLVDSFGEEIRGALCLDASDGAGTYYFRNDLKDKLMSELALRAGGITAATPLVMELLTGDKFWGTERDVFDRFYQNPPKEMTNATALAELGDWATVGELMPESAVAHIRAALGDEKDELFRRAAEWPGKYYVKADFMELSKILRVLDDMVINMKAHGVKERALEEFKRFIFTSFGEARDDTQRAYEEAERGFDRWWNTGLFAVLSPLSGVIIGIVISRFMNKPPRGPSGGASNDKGQSAAQRAVLDAATLLAFTAAALPFTAASRVAARLAVGSATTGEATAAAANGLGFGYGMATSAAGLGAGMVFSQGVLDY